MAAFARTGVAGMPVAVVLHREVGGCQRGTQT
jgi:hypothetical protein